MEAQSDDVDLHALSSEIVIYTAPNRTNMQVDMLEISLETLKECDHDTKNQ